ncbi:hypothetical protein NKH18_28070 [Streptomyces sp. M10(2022)]
MRKPGTITLLCFLALLAGACSSTTTEADSLATKRKTCAELFGDAGLKWIDSQTKESSELHFKSADTLDRTRSRIYGQVKQWTPVEEITQLTPIRNPMYVKSERTPLTN